VARLLLLGPAHEAAGTKYDEIDADTLDGVLAAAVARYGEGFRSILDVSQVWLNGKPTPRDTPVGPYDEIAVLPPVSGG
jgi:molybdopterin converting factor small subunit